MKVRREKPARLWRNDNPDRGKSTGSMAAAIRRARPLARFRVYCDYAKRGKFYDVVILRRITDLPPVARALTFKGRGEGWHRVRGFCHAFDVLRRTSRGWRPTRLAGYVVIPNSSVGSGVVSHEMTHAAQLRLARGPMGVLAFGDSETLEPLAYMQGWLVAQFWTEFYDRFPDVRLGPKQHGRKASA